MTDWFRDYVYIPLGGNRKGEYRSYLNMLAVWLLTGLWHGNGWNFLLWGIVLFLLISLERVWLGGVIEKRKWIGHIYMLLMIPLTWMIFAITNLHDLAVYAGRLVGLCGENVYSGDFGKYFAQYGIFVIIGIAFATKYPRALFNMIKLKPVKYIILLLLLGVSVYLAMLGMNDPFMYFQF